MASIYCLTFINKEDRTFRDEYTACMRCYRQPTFKEAEEICHSDISCLGFDTCIKIRKATEAELHDGSIDVTTADRYPIFG